MNEKTQREGTQLDRLLTALKSSQRLTLPELHTITGDPVTSLSANIRNLRKPEHGSLTIEKRRRGDAKRGLYEYWLDQSPEGN